MPLGEWEGTHRWKSETFPRVWEPSMLESILWWWFFRGCLWSVSCVSGSVHSVWREYSSCWPKWNFSSLGLSHHRCPAEASFSIAQYLLAWERDGQFSDRHLDLLRVLVIDLDQDWTGSSWLSCRHTTGKFNFCALEACAQLGVLMIILLLLRRTVGPAFEV